MNKSCKHKSVVYYVTLVIKLNKQIYSDSFPVNITNISSTPYTGQVFQSLDFTQLTKPSIQGKLEIIEIQSRAPAYHQNNNITCIHLP